MALIVPSAQDIYFEYTVYAGTGTLPIAMKVFDLSTPTPTLIGTVPMSHVYNGTYIAVFNFPDSKKNYLVQKTVYEDAGTYAVPDGTYSPGSEIVETDGFDGNQGITA